jgi:hypothetical protein
MAKRTQKNGENAARNAELVQGNSGLPGLSQERAGKRAQQGNSNRTRPTGRIDRKPKKDVFRGNELSYLLNIKGLAFLSAQNELVFERKNGKTNPKKWPKDTPFCTIRAQFALHLMKDGMSIPGSMPPRLSRQAGGS